MPGDRYEQAGFTMRSFGSFFVCALLFAVCLVSSCTQIQSPRTDPFYAETTPPKIQEFRWSNGKSPKTFDPARSAAAPETDIVRAIFEGLTEIDSKTLKENPAVAEKWSSSDDRRVWTFQLRKDARWSNGKRVTASDFVTSWKRLVDLGDKAAHRNLFRNIVGMNVAKPGTDLPFGESVDFGHTSTESELHQGDGLNPNSALRYQSQPTPDPSPTAGATPSATPKATVTPEKTAAKFGVEAINESTLRVTLELPDKDFAKLVANPIFRPVYGDGGVFNADPMPKTLVTNGAFAISSSDKDGVVLDRSDSYWNKAAVNLERIRLVPMESADAALDAYKKGEIDAVTNADFAPLAIKLLTPYEDFRRTTHSALNFYEFNLKNAPYSDRRIREALAIAIDRERLAEGELDGSVEPAKTFLSLNENNAAEVAFDVEHAREQLAAAGFPNGEAFPKIRLVINRNDLQQRVARAIARMWKQNLNVETEIIVKEFAEIDAARRSGDFDLVRRGVVLPTADEWISLSAIFDLNRTLPDAVTAETGDEAAPLNNPTQPAPAGKGPMDDGSIPESSESKIAAVSSPARFTEQAAIFEMRAIPLYFPKSYALVKPYVNGFEMNALDAMSVKDVSIDNAWQPKTVRGQL